MTDASCTCPIPAPCTRAARGACIDRPATHQHRVVKVDGSYYLVGVYSKLTGNLDRTAREAPGLLLLARYDEGDCDRPYNAKLMHSALYDAHQCHNFATTGDRIETPHGLFEVRGVHVEPRSDCSSDAKARRARLRREGRRLTAERVAQAIARVTG